MTRHGKRGHPQQQRHRNPPQPHSELKYRPRPGQQQLRYYSRPSLPLPQTWPYCERSMEPRVPAQGNENRPPVHLDPRYLVVQPRAPLQGYQPLVQSVQLNNIPQPPRGPGASYKRYPEQNTRHPGGQTRGPRQQISNYQQSNLEVPEFYYSTGHRNRSEDFTSTHRVHRHVSATQAVVMNPRPRENMAPMPPTYNAHAPQQTHDGLVVDVFKHNFMQAFDQMCHLVLTHKYIAMDTEFPGVVARPIGEFPTQQAFQYQQVRVNVNLLKLIQLGLTFFDENGNIPPTGPSTFQFNFQFDKASDMFSQESIQLLEKSGIPFHQLKEDGIPHSLFAEAFLSSGIVLTDDVTILSFHSSYDFGYLLRLLQAQYLPEKEAKFMSLLEQYFKNIYDIKFLMKSCKSLNGGLEDISKTLEIPRVGQQHQAGSDSLLTGKCFFAMRDQFFEGELERSRHGGRLFGITEHYGKQSNDDEATESYSSQPQSVDSIDFMRD